MDRRSFVKHTAHALAAPGILGSLGLSFGHAQSIEAAINNTLDTGRVLVIVFLDGGNDGLNTIVPLGGVSAMNKVRSHVFIPEKHLHFLPGTEVAMHPSWVGMQSLFTEGRLKIIQSVGYPEPNYSHFRSSDIWMSGSSGDVFLDSGWMGRYLGNVHPEYPEAYPSTSFPDPLAIEIGYGASLLFQGPRASMGMVISGPDAFYDLVQTSIAPTPANRQGDKLSYINLIKRQSQQYGKVVKTAANLVGENHVNFPDTDIAQQLKIVSKLIAGGLQTPIYMVRLGGFDTHDAQVVPGETSTGEHASLLRQLNDAIQAFMRDLERHDTADRVVGMTFSEFGRTINSNASNGTDHGTAAPMFFFGNPVSGGILGDNPIVPFSADYSSDIDMQYDFRQLYASVLNQWLGMDLSGINRVLHEDFETVPIIGEADLTPLEFEDQLYVYPNPIGNTTIIEFPSHGQNVTVDLVDMNGRQIEKIFHGKSDTNGTRLKWNTIKLQSGTYIIQVQGVAGKAVFRVVK